MRGQSLLTYSLRPMDDGDLGQVAAIEREAFPTLWPPTSYKREIRNRIAEYLVCVREGEYLTVDRKPGRLGRLFRRNKPIAPIRQRVVVGFVGLWFMAGEAHIVSIAVREHVRGQGLGELLLIGAIELGMARDAQVVTLEARVSNVAAKNLYAKYHFAEVGLRRAYYADNQEDAVIMTTNDLSSDDYQSAFDGLKSAFAERYGEIIREHI